MNFLKNSSYYFVFSALIVFTSCNKNLLVKYQQFELRKTFVALNNTNDSLFFNFEINLPQKSVGRRSVSMIWPVLIVENDTTKFEYYMLEGEKPDDAYSMPYKKRGTLCFSEKSKISPNEIERGIFKVLIYIYCKDVNKCISLFEKELVLK